MGQRSNANYAAVKDAQNKPRREDCALSMVRRSNYAYAAPKVVQNKSRGEGYVIVMGARRQLPMRRGNMIWIKLN